MSGLAAFCGERYKGSEISTRVSENTVEMSNYTDYKKRAALSNRLWLLSFFIILACGIFLMWHFARLDSQVFKQTDLGGSGAATSAPAGGTTATDSSPQ